MGAGVGCEGWGVGTKVGFGDGVVGSAVGMADGDCDATGVM